MQTAAGTMWLMVPFLLTEASFSGHGFKVRLSVGPWQQLIDVAVRMTVDDPGEGVGEIGQRIDVVEFARLCRSPNYAERARFPQLSR